MNDQLLIIFVTESDEIGRTDDHYISKFLYIHHGKEMQTNRYVVRYVHMNGKHNYNKKKVLSEINTYVKDAKSLGIRMEIIYCFDTDRLNNEDKLFLEEAEHYCGENKYRFVLFNPEIEPVFGMSNYKDKREAARRFSAKHITKDTLNINNYTYSIEMIYKIRNSSNLEIILKDIFLDKTNN